MDEYQRKIDKGKRDDKRKERTAIEVKLYKKVENKNDNLPF